MTRVRRRILIAAIAAISITALILTLCLIPWKKADASEPMMFPKVSGGVSFFSIRRGWQFMGVGS